MPDERHEPPEFYSDVFSVRLNPYTVLFEFAVRAPPSQDIPSPQGGEARPGPNRTVAVIRMSPEHAKVMAIILRRHIQAYESQAGVKINVPGRVLDELSIPPEDWNTFSSV